MAIIEFDKTCNDELILAARLGAIAAMNAPQITETVQVKVSIVTGKEDILPMIQYLRIRAEDSFVNYGEYRTFAKLYEEDNLPVVLIIGCTNLNTMELNWNCGACGFATCDEFNKFSSDVRGEAAVFGYGGGPYCAWKAMDVGIAYDWACVAVSECNVESRPQASVGQAAMAFDYVPGCEWVSGVVIGPSGGDQKWFNRPSLQNTFTEKDVIEHLHRALPSLFLAFPGTGDPKTKWGQDWEASPKFVRFKAPPKAFYDISKQKAQQIAQLVEKVKKKRSKKPPTRKP